MGFESGKRDIRRFVEIASMSVMLAALLTACGNAPQPQSQSATGEVTEQEAQPQETATDSAQMQAEMATAKEFIDAYDSRPGVTPFVIGKAFDPLDKTSPYHRETYEQELFTGGYAVRCTTDGVTADIIAFKSPVGYGIAVVGVGPTQQINGFYRDVVTVLDPQVDQQSVSKTILGAEDGTGDGKLTDTNLAQAQYINSGENSSVTILTAQYPPAETSTAEATETEDQNADQTEGWAIMALEDYGKQAYPYGFSLHKVLGVQIANHPSPDVWEFQITCDVTNEYGATAKDQICNATVNLVDGTWRVTDFSVH